MNPMDILQLSFVAEKYPQSLFQPITIVHKIASLFFLKNVYND